MNMMISFIIFLLLLPFLIAAFIYFDKIVKIEYIHYKNNWEVDGKPYGYFWKPLETKSSLGIGLSLKSTYAFYRCSLIWLFSTPEWLRNNAEASKYIKYLRISVLIWNIGVIIAAAIMFFGTDV